MFSRNLLRVCAGILLVSYLTIVSAMQTDNSRPNYGQRVVQARENALDYLETNTWRGNRDENLIEGSMVSPDDPFGPYYYVQVDQEADRVRIDYDGHRCPDCNADGKRSALVHCTKCNGTGYDPIS